MSRVAHPSSPLRLFRSDSHATGVARKAALKSWFRAAFGEVTADDLLFAGLPCALLALAIAVVWTFEWDVAVSRTFFCSETQRWPLAKIEPFATLYRSGCLPAICLGVAGLVIGLITLMVPRLRPARRPGLFLAFALALGPGVLVNGVLKPSVARPRPCQTDVFGGDHEFTYYGATLAAAKSFPSGHASMGFFFMTPALLFHRTRPRLAASILLGGFAYGALVGVARIAQGAHFTSDVLGAALVVYTSGVVVMIGRRVLKRWLARRDAAKTPPPRPDTEATTLPLHRDATTVAADSPTRQAA